MSASSDAIVVGVRYMGSPACYHWHNEGIKFLGREQFYITHEYGSHAGQSRIIRKAYMKRRRPMGLFFTPEPA